MRNRRICDRMGPMTKGVKDPESTAPTHPAQKPHASLYEAVLFWALYCFASMIVHMHAGNTGGIHQAVFGNTPGPTSMNRYAIGWPLTTAIIVVIHVRWLQSIRYGWLIGVIAGLLSFIPGMILCLIGIPR